MKINNDNYCQRNSGTTMVCTTFFFGYYGEQFVTLFLKLIYWPIDITCAKYICIVFIYLLPRALKEQ